MNSSQILTLLTTVLVSAIVYFIKKKFFPATVVVDTPTPKVYERGKGIIRYKYLTDADDGSQAKKDCFKLWDSQKQKHVYTVPYPNFEAEEGSVIVFEIEHGKDYGATIEVVEL
jgi:hypothetical protein